MSKTLVIYLIVLIGGACVLAIEILGTRVLGPFYGVSLFLWSALITVTLAALSAGYAVGGRLADRGARFSRLALILAGAGLWMLLVPWIKRPMLTMLEPLGLRAAVLLASTILFFPPLALLGMVSPYVIRLKARSLDEVGTTAGNIYAISTLASVVAAVLTGFVLIPNVGVSRLILMIGVTLLVGAFIALVASRQATCAPESMPASGASPLSMVLVLFVILAGGAAAVAIPTDQPDPDAGIIAIEQSPYAEIRVVDWEDMRLLLIDGGGHTIVEPEKDWRSHYPYVFVMELLKHFHDDPGRMLLMGLGGGSIVKSFHAAGWTVDAVEIDPVVVEVAHEYFGLDPSEATIHTMDGREYLAGHDVAYDLIVLDAFGSSAIPFHLVTTEVFGLIRERLSPGGVVAMNIEADGWRDLIVRSLSATLKTKFSEVLALPLSEPRTAFGNLILLASNRALEFDEDLLERPFDHLQDQYRHWKVVQQNHAWDNRFDPDLQGAPVLTDDLNPVDLWSEEINLKARKALHTSFDWKHLAY